MTSSGCGPSLVRRGRSAWLALSVLPCLAPARAGLSAQVCGHQPADSVAVRRVAEGIIAADNARDITRVLGFYAADAVLHPPQERPVVGRAAIRPRYEALFGSFDPAIVAELHSIRLCGTLAVVAGRNGGTLRGRQGLEDRELNDAFVMVLTKAGDRWSIRRLIWHPDEGSASRSP